MRETDAILQSILYQIEIAESLEDAKEAVKAMCNKENLDAVRVLVDERKKRAERVKTPS